MDEFSNQGTNFNYFELSFFEYWVEFSMCRKDKSDTNANLVLGINTNAYISDKCQKVYDSPTDTTIKDIKTSKAII